MALKIIYIPDSSDAHPRSHKKAALACMESAISSYLKHPNVVQTYTYGVMPLMTNAVPQEVRVGSSLGSVPPSCSRCDALWQMRCC